MDDLVMLLNIASNRYVNNKYNLYACAADRIEALDKRNKELEAALREIEMLHYDSETDFHHDAMKAHDIARAALGEKKDDNRN